MEGTVLSGTNNVFRILCDDGERRQCAIKGKRLKEIEGSYNSLAAGDRVELEADALDGKRGLVTRMVPRRNVFGRFNEKGRASQAIAANVDLVACIVSPKYPPFRPRFVDRVAVLAEAASVPPPYRPQQGGPRPRRGQRGQAGRVPGPGLRGPYGPRPRLEKA